MPYSMSMDLQPKTVQTAKQLQRLIMSRQMQQAIHLLQVPVLELGPIVELELEQNPVLEFIEEGIEEPETDPDLQRLEDEVAEEDTDKDTQTDAEVSFDERDFEILRRLDEDYRDYFAESGAATPRTQEQDKLQTFLESSVCSQPTLFEHLMQQAHEAFSEDRERSLAEELIGNIDAAGFLMTPLPEIAIVKGCTVEDLEKILLVIQTFHPTGVGGRNLQESLLIQLQAQKKAGTLAYAIVEKYFDDLIHNHIPAIKTGLHCSAEEIGAAIDQDISNLDLHPGAQLTSQTTSFIAPDLSLEQEGDKLIVNVTEESMPHLRLNGRYLRMLDDKTLTADAKEFIQQKVVSAKWLLRNIMQRNDTLKQIGEVLAVRQKEFFINPSGQLSPLTMKVVADELEMHESTIARAVSNKYIETPRGLLPLRSFFTNALATEGGGEISARTAKDLLQEIISNEDPHKPLSDESISALIKAKGIHCARRTVTKYRIALNIPTAQQRRKFN